MDHPKAADESIAAELRRRRERVALAGLRLAEAGGWRAVTVAQVAAETGLPLGDLVARLGSKRGLVAAIVRWLDDVALAPPAPAAEDTLRERLFELQMRRFEAVKDRRAGLKAVFQGVLQDPLGWGAALAEIAASRTRMIEAAGVDSTRAAGLARMVGLGLVELDVLRTFLDDPSADLAGTMARLDRALERMERWIGAVPGCAAAAKAASAAAEGWTPATAPGPADPGGSGAKAPFEPNVGL